jgi:hypothetical protein
VWGEFEPPTQLIGTRGDDKNVALKHRLMIGSGNDRWLVRLYWTRLSGEPNREFLAVEYIYTRRR